MKNLRSAVLVLGLLASVTAQAAGFLLDTQSARAVGMATAVTSFIDEPSAIYYNPAGLVLAKGLQIQVGANMILPAASIDPANPALPTTTVEANPVFPPFAFVSYRVSDAFAVGFGAYVPFGNTVKWPDDWFGNELALRSTLQNFYFTPSISLKIIPRIRFGVGYDIVRAVVEQERVLNFVDSTGKIDLGASTWGSGANIGAQFDLIENQLWLGAMFKSSVTLDFSGDVHFDNVPPELSSLLKDQGAKAQFTLPAQVQLGISGKPFEKLRLAIDVGYVDWSVFKAIDIQFDDPSLNTSDRKAWEARWNLRVGAEYDLVKDFQIRAGAKYDPTPSPADTLAPNLPDAIRVTANVGGSFIYKRYQIDLAYQATFLTSTTSTFALLPATYGGTAHVVNLTARAHFF